jgi:hypothetical protein
VWSILRSYGVELKFSVWGLGFRGYGLRFRTWGFEVRV